MRKQKDPIDWVRPTIVVAAPHVGLHVRFTKYVAPVESAALPDPGKRIRGELGFPELRRFFPGRPGLICRRYRILAERQTISAATNDRCVRDDDVEHRLP